MNNQRWMLGLAAGCAVGLGIAPRVLADVSDADFKALQEMVKKLSEKVGKLEEEHHADQDEIQRLRGNLPGAPAPATAPRIETNAPPAAVAAAAATAQPIHPIPTDASFVNRNFGIFGDAEVQFAKTRGENGTFLLADFAPIFLYRASDNILFEAGFDFILQNNTRPSPGDTTTVNLSFATLDYVMNDYLTLVAGNMLLPLGTYAERSAGWLNKFPDDPLARDLLPGNGVGAELRGAVPFGESGQSVTYSVFGVNGPSSSDGTGTAGALDLGGNVGLRSDNTVANLHGSPSGGGRVGWFIPYKPHYDFEIGLSGESGEWDDAGQHQWTAGVVDAALHLGANFEAKGELIRTWYGSDDAGPVATRGWWAQAGYKLAGLNLDVPFVGNVELVGRFDRENDGLGTKTRRYSVGYVYYISNALLFEGDYEFTHGNDPGLPGDRFIMQLSYGF